VLIAIELWRLSQFEKRTVWAPGAALFGVSALALIVLVGGDGVWSAIAIFGTIVLASDALLLKGQLVASLCTREEPAKDPP
jgi:hypothetical protein